MIHRALTDRLAYLAGKFPVVSLTGPRQSGKTTLVRAAFPDKDYVSLEDPGAREFALTDPRGFLNQFAKGVIIDEAQYVPQLFSYIQVRVDESQKLGEFILTGSQNFLLLEKITQSLAGRVAVLHLLPLSIQELGLSGMTFGAPFPLIYQGFYPRIYDQGISAEDYYKSYITTYLERDVRQLKNISDLSKFQLFIKLCAGRIGQLFNMSSIANDCGVDQTTVKSWLSVLEASFIACFLRPHYNNFRKRLVKQPKLYFCDTGVACYLLGLRKPEDLIAHHMRGALFENFIVMELMKQQFNQGKDHNLNFWRDNYGHEIDVLMTFGEKMVPVEVKSSQTISNDLLKSLFYWQRLTEDGQRGYLVYAGESSQERSSVTVLSWKELERIAEGKA